MLEYAIDSPYKWFVILVAVAMICSFGMSVCARKFYTHFGVTRKFSILDIQFVSSKRDFYKIINGIYRLPEATKILRALRLSLVLDFLFMPAIYGSVFILCMSVSIKMSGTNGGIVFALFAWLQLLAWLLDIIENVFVLTHLKKVDMDSHFQDSRWRGFKYVVHTKWSIALLGGICSSMVLLCYWLEGLYNPGNLCYLAILAGEMVAFFVLMVAVSIRKNSEKSSQSN